MLVYGYVTKWNYVSRAYISCHVWSLNNWLTHDQQFVPKMFLLKSVEPVILWTFCEHLDDLNEASKGDPELA